MKLIKLIPLLIIFAPGCSEQNSDLKLVSDNIRDKMNGINLTEETKEKLCNTKSLIYFIGNGETTVATKPENQPSSKIKDRNYLINIIHKDIEDFKSGLSEKGPHCSADSKLEVKFAAIIDGPNTDDSSITTYSYGFQDKKWGLISQQSFSFQNDQLSKSSNEKFEIHLPTQINKIIESLYYTDKNGDPTTEGSEYYNQTNYFFKSHGGMADISGNRPNLADIVNNSKYNKSDRHVFLFDPNGPNQKNLASELKIPFWKIEVACKILKKRGINLPRLRKRCAEITTQKENSDSLNYGTNTAELDTGTNSTELDTGTNSTELDAGTNSTELDAGTNSTELGFGTQQTDLEIFTQTNDLSPFSSGAILGAGTGAGDLGSIKSKSYISEFDAHRTATLEKPSHVLRLAQAVSWDSFGLENKGVFTLKLIGTNDRPSTVFFESCKQKVKNTAKVADLIFGEKKPSSVTFFGSHDLLYASATQFDRLTAEHYLLLPIIFENDLGTEISYSLERHGLLNRGQTEIIPRDKRLVTSSVFNREQ